MQYLRIYLPKFFNSLRDRGLLTTAREILRVVYRDLSEWHFDRKWGISTRGVKVHSRENPNSAYFHAEMYEATTPRMFRKIMHSIRHIRIPRTFIDMGSGKGRVMFMAAECGFSHIVGVELDPYLAKIAEENVESFQCRQQASRVKIEVVCRDAGTYRFPDEDAVIFLYNPFGEAVMRRVLENLRGSACTEKERYIIYLNPVWKSLFCDPNEFAPIVTANVYAIYRVVPLPSVRDARISA